MRSLLVTGGAGFIGSNFATHIMQRYPDDRVVVFDKLTYAGNKDNLLEVADNPRFRFVQGDICDAGAVAKVVEEEAIDVIVNFAAETHVDRSIMDQPAF